MINKVANSTLISFNLEDYYPKEERKIVDIKDQLYEGLMLKEKDFREWIKTNDWTIYQDKFVAISCSADAIIPSWAYMLLVVKLENITKLVIIGGLETLEIAIWNKVFKEIEFAEFLDAKIVIKGCSKYGIPLYAYTELTRILRPIVSSLMYGEPCSTVPLYKKAKEV